MIKLHNKSTERKNRNQQEVCRGNQEQLALCFIVLLWKVKNQTQFEIAQQVSAVGALMNALSVDIGFLFNLFCTQVEKD
jgi:hypothetical protein